MTARLTAAPRLDHMVPEIVALLRHREPAWADMQKAHESAVAALFNILEGLRDPDVEFRMPGHAEPVRAALLTEDTLQLLLRSLQRGATRAP